MATTERLRTALRHRYAITEVVGRGGSATVLLGRDRKYGRPVAVKVLHAELTNPHGAERFLAEVRITAGLQHPNILPLLDSGQAAGHLYLVTPFVRGSSLADRLRTEGRLAVPEALRIAIAVAEALAYAHEQGVVHLDVKPANILLSNGHPVIADFGIARAVSDSRGDARRAGPAGTPEYMSPEQAAGKLPLDGRSDVYSLSCLLHEMLVGWPPFAGSTAGTVLARQMYSEPPTVSQATRGRVSSLDDLVLRGLAKDPVDRYQTAADFAAALKAGLATPGPRPVRTASAVFGVVLLAGLAWSALGAAAPAAPEVESPPAAPLNAEVPPGTTSAPAAPRLRCPVQPHLTL